jgi:UDP-glucose 4-epimerase
VTALLDAELVVGDIRDRELVTDLCRSRGVDAVVHFAAYKNVGESMLEPAKYWRNNVTGTVELVEAMLAADVHRIVFSSSCSVNGTPATVPVTRTRRSRPRASTPRPRRWSRRSWAGTASPATSGR